jgi:hypothetical protein
MPWLQSSWLNESHGQTALPLLHYLVQAPDRAVTAGGAILKHSEAVRDRSACAQYMQMDVINEDWVRFGKKNWLLLKPVIYRPDHKVRISANQHNLSFAISPKPCRKSKVKALNSRPPLAPNSRWTLVLC